MSRSYLTLPWAACRASCRSRSTASSRRLAMSTRCSWVSSRSFLSRSSRSRSTASLSRPSDAGRRRLPRTSAFFFWASASATWSSAWACPSRTASSAPAATSSPSLTCDPIDPDARADADVDDPRLGGEPGQGVDLGAGPLAAGRGGRLGAPPARRPSLLGPPRQNAGSCGRLRPGTASSTIGVSDAPPTRPSTHRVPPLETRLPVAPIAECRRIVEDAKRSVDLDHNTRPGRTPHPREEASPVPAESAMPRRIEAASSLSRREVCRRVRGLQACHVLGHHRLGELLELAGVGVELADAFAQLLDGHRVLVVHPAEGLLVEVDLLRRRWPWPPRR